MVAKKVVLAIDPGRQKCGIAVAEKSSCFESATILYQSVIETEVLKSSVSKFIEEYNIQTIIIGNGTSSKDAIASISEIASIQVILVDEKMTTLLARKRYFKENPPRGLKKLIPMSLQHPDKPFDDYVAVILAERFFEDLSSQRA